MKIGELAQAAHCTPETIRYYEKSGLMFSPQRTQANYRVYTAAHLERLRFIRNCRSLDMTHEEIRSLLEYIDHPPSDCAPVNALIEEHMRHVDTRLQELQLLRHQLSELRQSCHRPGGLEQCGIVQSLRLMDTESSTTQPCTHIT